MSKSVDDSNGADRLSQLRAECVDSGDGRVYLIGATDGAGISGFTQHQIVSSCASRKFPVVSSCSDSALGAGARGAVSY